jgi:hypothetical protein
MLESQRGERRVIVVHDYPDPDDFRIKYKIFERIGVDQAVLN